jgi:hypothetical protein
MGCQAHGPRAVRPESAAIALYLALCSQTITRKPRAAAAAGGPEQFGGPPVGKRAIVEAVLRQLGIELHSSHLMLDKGSRIEAYGSFQVRAAHETSMRRALLPRLCFDALRLTRARTLDHAGSFEPPASGRQPSGTDGPCGGRTESGRDCHHWLTACSGCSVTRASLSRVA